MISCRSLRGWPIVLVIVLLWLPATSWADLTPTTSPTTSPVTSAIPSATTSATASTTVTTTSLTAPSPPSATASTTSTATTSRAATQTSSRAAAARGGDPGVAVVDFAFHPGTVTVHVGDTISWTNSGAQPHTATANNGSFNTGILTRGQTGSHTFPRVGTFTYFCTVHPFMKGTVVVLPAAGQTPAATHSSTSAGAATPAGGSTTPASASTAGTAQPAASASAAGGAATLPLTGMPVLTGVLLGLLLVACGGAVRLAMHLRAR